jgi:hypothetical protein
MSKFARVLALGALMAAMSLGSAAHAQSSDTPSQPASGTPSQPAGVTQPGPNPAPDPGPPPAPGPSTPTPPPAPGPSTAHAAAGAACPAAADGLGQPGQGSAGDHGRGHRRPRSLCSAHQCQRGVR